ncbi:MAG TPA: excinuclease ABC subunit UvrA [Chloroflexus aurantiacus]|jgi:excinuclease ABC subunit A|uniref:UvrABC system protein A n=1 Tax=Chloroflexus aurantiacus (strain ATCC 29366 / DSM 635 / J-10-fl) TaxID=324602 RepID=A9WIX2_CHLAA|nr:excinuclease ABC subunit UvrA [Chloroflexus aurantiacus]ABY35849.1 excinuclease ABC, A subunit [Chloroflexus aurantiacus J-10-fl]RMG51492.1 MAG: excinuclease ABC subunit UvrA [Chloroflexota bacterium]GIV91669.1 MAG: UvrABC system protein A [Chloroflexus sp.]HBW69284.1 excinuclease ABC subunit UvrA [Chloroflexus aurantiacus]
MDWIRIRGARTHNLKQIDLDIPRGKLVAITGVSGSGKSSLAFDTIFAEGQRRYVESLSVYARQLLGQIEKPDVDLIEGLSPAIAIDQKGSARNPRSTVGTVTEIYDFLRLLFARIGQPHCPQCRSPLRRYTPQQMVDVIVNLPVGRRVLLLAPLTGESESVLSEIRRRGFVRARIDGTVYDLDEPVRLEKYQPHTIEAIVDRLIIRQTTDGTPALDRVRVADSVETALKLSGGQLIVQVIDGDEYLLSERYTCPQHGPLDLGQLEPRDFSFNSPQGSCPTCTGLGIVPEFDPALVIPDRSLPLLEAIAPWREGDANSQRYYRDMVRSFANHFGIDPTAPVSSLSPECLSALLYGTGGEPITLHYHVNGQPRSLEAEFEGVIPNLRRRLAGQGADGDSSVLEQYTTPRACPACAGTRLRAEVRAILIAGRSIADVHQMTIGEAFAWASWLLEQAQLSPRDQTIARPIVHEITQRLRFLQEVGLAYLTLDRTTMTLSGGEMQRVRLATQLGAGLSGVLYVLDEPSSGLHPRDHDRLLATLFHLRDLGNSLVVVEHDEATIRAADWIVDIGPGAGPRGGEVVVNGSLPDLLQNPRSLTGQYLSGQRRIPLPAQRRQPNGRWLELRGCRANNLKNIDVRIPLGCFVVVSGVSGSGKSSLIGDTLAPRLSQLLHGGKTRAGEHDALLGIEHLERVVVVDQSPIGRTPRSNPATYSRIFDTIRQLFAATNEAKARGYDAARFSFNVKGGRCEHCAGEGLIQVEMQFLPDLFVPCDVCHGTRYNRETLDIRYRGLNIAEVLDLTIADALDFFARVPTIAERLQTLHDVGLDYLKLGQPAPTLSGGEAQRIKLAAELSRRSNGHTLYILDEPTTGLHLADIDRLLFVLQRLVDAGNTVLVIEHQLDLIAAADWVIELGPEGGERGGYLIGAGPPETIAAIPVSPTGAYLRQKLAF